MQLKNEQYISEQQQQKDKIPLFDICQTERGKKKKNWKEENIVYYTFYGSELQKAIRNTAELLGNF